jgi:hypothetical protein
MNLIWKLIKIEEKKKFAKFNFFFFKDYKYIYKSSK